MPTHPTATSSCTYCRRRFPTAEITTWIDGPAQTPLCPRCGVDAVIDGAHPDHELERLHILGFDGERVLVDALRSARVAKHGVGLGVSDDDAGMAVSASTIALLVGPNRLQVVVDPPGRERTDWRVRVPTSVKVGVDETGPGRAARLHDTDIAPVLRLAGFELTSSDLEVLADDDSERHRAVWERTAVDAADAASVIKAIEGLETVIDSNQEADFWAFMGDLSAMQALASRLSGIGTAYTTPWGLTLHAPNGRELAVMGAQGNGRFNAALALPAGFGKRAAKRRAEAALVWFEAQVAPEWRAQGFTNPQLGGVVDLEVDPSTGWAVVITLSFDADGDELVAMLEWARDHGDLRLPMTS